MDMQGFGYIPKTATLRTLPHYRDAIVDLIKRPTSSTHKARELLIYLEKGVEGLYKAKQQFAFQFMSLDELVSLKTNSK
jgi:hypothetical protein